MKKYLYLPCVAILALTACDDNDSTADQQSQTTTPPSVTEEAVQESIGPDGSAPLAEVTTPESPAPETPAAASNNAVDPTDGDPAYDNQSFPPESDTMGNAGPDADMSAEATPPAPSPENFNEGSVQKKLDPDKTCGDYSDWVGKPLDEAAVKATNSFARIMKPGDPMTMDHNPDRVNVEHDDANIVTRVWCG